MGFGTFFEFLNTVSKLQALDFWGSGIEREAHKMICLISARLWLSLGLFGALQLLLVLAGPPPSGREAVIKSAASAASPEGFQAVIKSAASAASPAAQKTVKK